MNPRLRNILIAVGLIALVIGIGVFASNKPKDTAIGAKTTTVAYLHFTTRLPETGVVQRPQTQTMAALVSGNLGSLTVHAGDRVAEGQVLATIENPQLQESVETAHQAYLSASARASQIAEANAAIPAQNRSSIVQAEAAVEQARVNLVQAEKDVQAGSQSGLGYGGQTAEEQRLSAEASVANADTNANEAKRILDADRDLFANKAISKDAVDQAQARYDQAKVTDDQTRRQRLILQSTLGRNKLLLQDRVRAAADQLRQARAQLASARASAASSKNGDLAAARADVARAAAEAEFAEKQLARTQIRAPFAGTIQTLANNQSDSLRPIQVGDTIAQGQALMTIAGDGGFIVRTKVDEQDVAQIHTGQRAKISGEDLGGTALFGHILNVSPVAQKSDDPSNTARQVITTIALEQTVPYLRDGMSVDVDIITKDLTRVLGIPSEAVHHDTPSAKPWVYVVDATKHARKTTFVAGQANDTQTLVNGGLTAGQTIVADAAPLVTDGVIVAPSPQPDLAKASARPKS